MEQLMKLLENKFSLEELQKIATILDKKYRYSIFFDGWIVLNEVVFIPANIDVSEYKGRFKFNDVFNSFIMKYGKNESIIKYYLTKEFIYNKDEVCMFEFPVRNSRADFVRINGVSHAYEIKTEIDTIDRLENQLADYLTVFEYVTVVLHPKHIKKVKKLISRRIGIMTYVPDGRGIKFDVIREATPNKDYKKGIQLDTLNSNDLGYIIKSMLECDVPIYKEERYKLIRTKYNKENLNFAFKEAIKNSRQKKWEHIKLNFDMLKPIEIQAAFSGKF